MAPLTYGAGLGYSFINHFYARIREDLRPPVDHWHVFAPWYNGIPDSDVTV